MIWYYSQDLVYSMNGLWIDLRQALGDQLARTKDRTFGRICLIWPVRPKISLFGIKVVRPACSHLPFPSAWTTTGVRPPSISRSLGLQRVAGPTSPLRRSVRHLHVSRSARHRGRMNIRLGIIMVARHMKSSGLNLDSYSPFQPVSPEAHLQL